jgi:hypothetical protein
MHVAGEDFFADLDRKLSQDRSDADAKSRRIEMEQEKTRALVAEATPIIKQYEDGFIERRIRVDTSYHDLTAEIKVRYRDGGHYGLRLGFNYKTNECSVEDLYAEKGNSFAGGSSGVMSPDYVKSGNFTKRLEKTFRDALTYANTHGGLEPLREI